MTFVTDWTRILSLIGTSAAAEVLSNEHFSTLYKRGDARMSSRTCKLYYILNHRLLQAGLMRAREIYGDRVPLP